MLKVMVLGVIIYITVHVYIINIGHVGHKCGMFLLLGSICLLGTASIVCLSSRSFIQVVTVSPTVIIMCTLASTSVAIVFGLMSKPSARHTFWFALESAITHVMVHKSADLQHVGGEVQF